ncbi:MAG: hypothetical protein AAGF14_04975, partial [Pseudomonadota bacterium]
PEFRGRVPELGRHLFDPHWNAESEKEVAAFMLKQLPTASLAKGKTRSLSRRAGRDLGRR